MTYRDVMEELLKEVKTAEEAFAYASSPLSIEKFYWAWRKADEDYQRMLTRMQRFQIQPQDKYELAKIG